MIDGIIDTAIDAASPAITKWRSFFLIISLVLVSPELDNLFSQNIYLVDVKSSISLLGDLLSSSRLLIAAFLALFFYFIVPFINSWLLKYFASKNIIVAEPLISQIDKLKKCPKEEIESIIGESFEAKKEIAISADESISANKERTEIASMACMMYLFSSMYLEVFNYYLFLFLLITYVIFSYFISRKILIDYLKSIAPYKVLEDYVKYVVLVK